jgi:hypothetical protein
MIVSLFDSGHGASICFTSLSFGRVFGVTGRFKTSHSWALQNQPRLWGGSRPQLDCNRFNLLFKVSDVDRLSLAPPFAEFIGVKNAARSAITRSFSRNRPRRGWIRGLA